MDVEVCKSACPDPGSIPGVSTIIRYSRGNLVNFSSHRDSRRYRHLSADARPEGAAQEQII